MIRTCIYAIILTLETGNVFGFNLPPNFAIVSYEWGHLQLKTKFERVAPGNLRLNARVWNKKKLIQRIRATQEVESEEVDNEECTEKRTKRGFIKNKSNLGPERAAFKIRRNKHKSEIRRQKELKNIESYFKLRRRRDREARGSGYGRYNTANRPANEIFSFTDLIQMHNESFDNQKKERNLKESSMKFLSTHVIGAFQMAKTIAAITEMVDEFIAIRGKNNDGICHPPLSTILSARDETNLIRLLGARGAYDAMLKYLRFLASDQYISLSTDHISGASVFAYTAAITALAQSSDRRYRSMSKHLLKEMEENGVQPNTFVFTALFLSVDGGSEAKKMMVIAKNCIGSAEIGIHLYNSAIYACSRGTGKKDKDFQTALYLFREMQKKGIKRDERTFASMLHVCAKNGQARVAISLLDEMKRIPGLSKPNAKVWGAVLRACATRGEYKKAIEFLLEMRSDGVKPNVLHYNSVFAALAKSGEKDLALKLLNHMHNGTAEHFSLDLSSNITFSDEDIISPSVQADLISLNTVLRAYTHPENADFDGAFKLLNRMKKGEFTIAVKHHTQRIDPDVISYNTVLSACEDPKVALTLLNEMSEKASLRPTAVTYTNAIGVCRRATPPDLKTAIFLLDDASEKGVPKNVFMYSAAIWTAERNGDWETALSILNSMKRQLSSQPNAVSYDGVISSLATHGYLEKAFETYLEMKEKRVAPTLVTYQKLAIAARKSYSKIGIPAAVNILEQIVMTLNGKDFQVIMSGPIFGTLIRAYGLLNDYDKAAQIFHSLDRTNGQCLSAMLYVCSTSSPARWQDALVILHCSDIIVGRKGSRYVEAQALSYAMIACAKENEWEEALNILELYGCPIQKEDGIYASNDAFNSVIAAAGRSGRPDIALKLLNDMPSKYSVEPDERSYRSAIIACNQAEHEKRRQREKGTEIVPPDEDVNLNNDFQWRVSPKEDALSFQYWEAALSLLRRMQEQGITPDIQTYSSAISACQASGQWQRAIGILRKMTRTTNSIVVPNLFCFNAAIAACEKGDAWLEALELYERMKDYSGIVKPNFITVNSILIVLDRAKQSELAESLYIESLRDKIVNPWRWRRDNDRTRIRAMDLHQFSSTMAKVAVASVMNSLLGSVRTPHHDMRKDLILIVGKGKGSRDGKPILLPEIMNLLREEYGIEGLIDQHNTGRIRIPSPSLIDFVRSRSWN